MLRSTNRLRDQIAPTLMLFSLFADPMVGYWCRVGSLALTHTRTDIFGAVAIWDQRRTMLMARPPRDPSLLSWHWGSAPSGSGGPSSAVGLTSLPIVNSHAESAAMLDPSNSSFHYSPSTLRCAVCSWTYRSASQDSCRSWFAMLSVASRRPVHDRLAQTG